MITSQMFTVKGGSPWYSVWWADDYRVVGRAEHAHDGATITCDGDVTSMQCMFWGCCNLTTIRGIIDMKSCTDCAYMFKDCYNLRSVRIKNPPADFNGEGLSPSQYAIVS